LLRQKYPDKIYFAESYISLEVVPSPVSIMLFVFVITEQSSPHLQQSALKRDIFSLPDYKFSLDSFRLWFTSGRSVGDETRRMPLFGKSSKTPTEVVKLLKEALATLEKGGDGKKQEKAQERFSGF
jgi:hypothetical protein